MTRAQQAERAEALERLREWLKPGDTVYTILRHVSRSGMQRTIDVVHFDARGATHDGRQGTPLHLGYNIAQALGMSYDRQREGVKVGGCGMDMGFHLVYSLSSALFRDGFGCVGEGCPSNDHSNGDRDYRAHVSCEYGCRSTGGRAAPDACVHPDLPGQHTHWHRDGGYALRARWL